MITDKVENIERYSALYPNISRILASMNREILEAIFEKTIVDGIALIPISSSKVSASFDETLFEAHITTMDIHITLQGVDVIAYADLDSEAKVFKPYDEQNDYLLAHSNEPKTLQVPKGYFCIIPNNFAHMALYEGHSDVRKVVVKLPVAS